MAYRVGFDPDALKDPKKLDQQVQLRLPGFLEMRVGKPDDPRAIGEPLAGARPGPYWKYRVDDRRIICDIEDHRIVVRVLRPGNRREVYR